MELNREQIIKALECCDADNPTCGECPFYDNHDYCWNVNKQALALIKELTEENDRLRDTAYRLECEVHRERADTVGKMQHKIWLEFSDCTEEEEISVGSFRASVDQIAKEMLEDKQCT